MTDYVVLAPPGVNVQVYGNVRVDAPVLLERGKVAAWVELQDAIAKARAAGLDVDTLMGEAAAPPTEDKIPVARLSSNPWPHLADDEPAEPLDPDAVEVPPDVAAANPDVRVYQTPNLDREIVSGKCGALFHVEQRDLITNHLASCVSCRRDPRLEPLRR